MLCVSVCPSFHVLNQLTDFHEVRYEYYATGGLVVPTISSLRNGLAKWERH